MNYVTTRYQLRVFAGNSGLGLSLLRLHPKFTQRVVTRRTEVCVEGFPRSANSFFIEMLKLRCPSLQRIAHHVHVPAQVTRALRLNVPTVVLIREPLGALSSLLAVSNSTLDVRVAIDSYVRFYDSLLSVRSACVIADFPTVTSDIRRVFTRMRSRFQLPIDAAEATESEISRSFETLQTRNVVKRQPENLLAVPHAKKQRASEHARRALRDCRRFAAAEAVYRQWVEDGSCQSSATVNQAIEIAPSDPTRQLGGAL